MERAPLKRLERVLASAIEGLDDLPDGTSTERREAFHCLLLLLCHRRSAELRVRLATTVTTRHREEVDEMKKMSAIETWASKTWRLC